MYLKEGILLVIGGVTGWIVFILPHVLWLDTAEKLDKEAFVTTLPEKAKVYELFWFLPYIWIVMYIFFVFPNLPNFNNGEGLTFFSTYLLLGGLGVLDGLGEVSTSIAPIRVSGKVRGAITLKYLASHETVRRTGYLRIGLTIVVGIIAWFIL